MSLQLKVGRKARTLAVVVANLVAVVGFGVATAAPSHADINRCVQNDTWSDHFDGTGYLDAAGSGGSGTAVVTWNFNNHSNQHWCLEKAWEGGWYFHPSYNLGLCMAIPQGNYQVGERVIIWTCDGGREQRFNVPRDSSTGYNTINPVDAPNLGLTGGDGNGPVYLNSNYDLWH